MCLNQSLNSNFIGWALQLMRQTNTHMTWDNNNIEQRFTNTTKVCSVHSTGSWYTMTKSSSSDRWAIFLFQNRVNFKKKGLNYNNIFDCYFPFGQPLLKSIKGKIAHQKPHSSTIWCSSFTSVCRTALAWTPVHLIYTMKKASCHSKTV